MGKICSYVSQTLEMAEENDNFGRKEMLVYQVIVGMADNDSWETSKVTQEEIAKRARYSRVSVSKALRNIEQEGFIVSRMCYTSRGYNDGKIYIIVKGNSRYNDGEKWDKVDDVAKKVSSLEEKSKVVGCDREEVEKEEEIKERSAVGAKAVAGGGSVGKISTGSIADASYQGRRTNFIPVGGGFDKSKITIEDREFEDVDKFAVDVLSRFQDLTGYRSRCPHQFMNWVKSLCKSYSIDKVDEAVEAVEYMYSSIGKMFVDQKRYYNKKRDKVTPEDAKQLIYKMIFKLFGGKTTEKDYTLKECKVGTDIAVEYLEYSDDYEINEAGDKIYNIKHLGLIDSLVRNGAVERRINLRETGNVYGIKEGSEAYKVWEDGEELPSRRDGEDAEDLDKVNDLIVDVIGNSEISEEEKGRRRENYRGDGVVRENENTVSREESKARGTFTRDLDDVEEEDETDDEIEITELYYLTTKDKYYNQDGMPISEDVEDLDEELKEDAKEFNSRFDIFNYVD